MIATAVIAVELTAAVPAIGGEPPALLPDGVVYDETVPTPREVIGYDIGRWHLRHDQLLAYLERVVASSPRLRLVEQGRTHEDRRLVLVVASSESNLTRLDELLERRRRLYDESPAEPPAAELEELPVVVYLGYSIHGNEASGSNASALLAYHLAAARDPRVEEWLERSVVVIDPSLNPDGLGRFATWVNMHRGVQAVADGNNREHVEGWPSGRTNHYWFDLNRDWLLLQHPESRARVATLGRFRPDLVGDFHEMGSDSTYFFQPGVPERENPGKPPENLELTRRLAEFHARALGDEGQLFYSEETFDDFYPGKGSTYPDLTGSVGVLFEQASARGHVQETDNGLLTFERAIRNHLLTSMSMIAGANALDRELIGYQAAFGRQALASAARDQRAGFVFGCPHDLPRCGRLIDILRGHRIRVHALSTGLEVGERTYDPAWSWFVPVDQAQYRLVKSLFELETEFRDSTFYDVSTWNLPLAFAARFDAVARDRLDAGAIGAELSEGIDTAGRFEPDAEAYAYLFEWSSYFAPRTLRRLLEAGFRPRVATRPFTATIPGGRRDFDRGTIVVPVGGVERPDRLEEVLATAAAEDGVEVWAASSGLTPSGVDLGSPSVEPLEPVRPAIVVGRGISSYDVGEIWHLLDQRFGFEVTLLPKELLGRVDLADYTHLLLVDGRYDWIDEEGRGRLEAWIEGGGVLVATKGAALWAEDLFLSDEEREGAPAASESEPIEPSSVPERRAYADYEKDRAAELVSGAIVEAELDLTHPLAYGYRVPRLPLFRDSSLELARPADPYRLVAAYSEEPLLSGYLSEDKRSRLAGGVALVAWRQGDGTVVLMADDPDFRAVWYGTSRLVLNSLFFARVLRATSPPSEW